jgi:hypothetical protein
MVSSWSDIQGKIKEAYNKIETAYNQIETGAGKVKKEHRILNTAVRIALPNIPIVGQYLKDWYDDAGGEEEDKTKQILQFLKKLEQQSEEQFKRISEDFKINLDVIVSSNIEITQLISKTSTEILEEVHKVRQDTTVIRQDVKEVKEILKTHQAATIQQLTYAKKPETFRGEKPIFIGRQNYIDKIKEYFRISPNYPISIVGIGGMGKSTLAYKTIHQCEEMFDLIIPIYFAELGISLNSFLSSIAKSLNIDEAEFDKLQLEEQKQFLIDTLGKSNTHPLIFADNYETISGVLKDDGWSTSSSSSSSSSLCTSTSTTFVFFLCARFCNKM